MGCGLLLVRRYMVTVTSDKRRLDYGNHTFQVIEDSCRARVLRKWLCCEHWHIFSARSYLTYETHDDEIDDRT
jgi:hypothetical protein